MNREIKFRVYNTRSKEWIHGPRYEVNLFGETILLGAFMQNVSIQDLNHCVALQYIGLNLDSGHEVYEGDIINTMKNRYVIEYSKDNAKYIGRGLFHDKDVVDVASIVRCGICLGNIFENVDLIKLYE
jgi:hypothetical protein